MVISTFFCIILMNSLFRVAGILTVGSQIGKFRYDVILFFLPSFQAKKNKKLFYNKGRKDKSQDLSTPHTLPAFYVFREIKIISVL